MPTLDLNLPAAELPSLEGAIVILVPLEEGRPVIADTCRSGDDRQRILAWVASQPDLLELYVGALRLSGADVAALDRLCEQVGSESGDDEEWLRSLAEWFRLPASERRRLMQLPLEGEDAA